MIQIDITAEDVDPVTFQVINKPAGAVVNQSGNMLRLTWLVTSSRKVNCTILNKQQNS